LETSWADLHWPMWPRPRGSPAWRKWPDINPPVVDYNNVPGCTYTSPEVASVGMTEKAAREAGYELKVGKFPFTASGKASAAGAKEGFVKLVFDAKYGELLGAHLIGANVTEMIAELVVARKLETTGEEIIKAVHPHPTMSEASHGSCRGSLRGGHPHVISWT
jgi:dihydrolipoamide dehydrogenase